LASDISRLLSEAVKRAYTAEPYAYGYVVSFNQDKVIYESYDYSDGGAGYGCYQRSYTINADGSTVTLADDIERVHLITQVVVANVADAGATRSNASAPEGEEETEPMAGEPIPGAGSAPSNPQGTTPTTPAVTGSETPPPVAPVAPPAEPRTAAAAASAPPATFDQLLASASPEVREQLEQGRRILQASKDGIIAGLKASGRCKFTDDQLKAFSLDQLESLAALANVPTYEGRASPTPIAANAQSAADEANRPPKAQPVFTEEYLKGLQENIGRQKVA
jgi:hypothetical protein